MDNDLKNLSELNIGKLSESFDFQKYVKSDILNEMPIQNN